VKITGGDTVSVYRFDRDRFGDKVNDTHVGDIQHCVLQWTTASKAGLRFHPNDTFQETSSTSLIIYAPRDAAVKIEGRDRVKVNGRTYQVIGNRAWDIDNPATGYNFGYYMVQVEVTQ
jgi:hypothetical protein